MTIERRETGETEKSGKKKKKKAKKKAEVAPSKPVAQKAPSLPNPKQDGFTVVKKGAVLRSVITDKYVTVGDSVTLMGHENYPIVIAKGSTV